MSWRRMRTGNAAISDHASRDIDRFALDNRWICEPASTLNTGNVRNERTVAEPERI